MLISLCSRNGAPGEIRTPDLQVRSLLLYPAELRAPDNGKHRQNAPGRQAFFYKKFFQAKNASFPAGWRRQEQFRLDHKKNVSYFTPTMNWDWDKLQEKRQQQQKNGWGSAGKGNWGRRDDDHDDPQDNDDNQKKRGGPSGPNRPSFSWPKLPKMRYILVLGVYLIVFDLTMPCPSKGDAYRVDELLFDKNGIVLDIGGDAVVPDRREHEA